MCPRGRFVGVTELLDHLPRRVREGYRMPVQAHLIDHVGALRQPEHQGQPDRHARQAKQPLSFPDRALFARRRHHFRGWSLTRRQRRGQGIAARQPGGQGSR